MAERIELRASLRIRPTGRVEGVRPFQATDEAKLGELMYRGYRGTVDYDGETPDDAAAEIRKTVQGAYGEFLADCSFVAEQAGTLASAVLVTRWRESPLLAYSFTDPGAVRRGLATACIEAAMGRLLERGERELRLVVTRANVPAARLYQKLGFRPLDEWDSPE